MGGFGSGNGGDNRIKDSVENYRKIDSFYYNNYIKFMDNKGYEHLRIGDFNIYCDRIEAIGATIPFESVHNNYGGADRLYFLCPYCERRVRYLYCVYQCYKCRMCANLNYQSQQMTKGDGMAAHKMKKFLWEKFEVTGRLSAMDALYYRPERPKGMHRKTYYKLHQQFIHLKREYISHLQNYTARLRNHYSSGL